MFLGVLFRIKPVEADWSNGYRKSFEVTRAGSILVEDTDFFAFFTLSPHIRLAAPGVSPASGPCELGGVQACWSYGYSESFEVTHVGSILVGDTDFLLFAPWYIRVLLIGALRLLFASSGNTPETG